LETGRPRRTRIALRPRRTGRPRRTRRARHPRRALRALRPPRAVGTLSCELRPVGVAVARLAVGVRCERGPRLAPIRDDVMGEVVASRVPRALERDACPIRPRDALWTLRAGRPLRPRRTGRPLETGRPRRTGIALRPRWTGRPRRTRWA